MPHTVSVLEEIRLVQFRCFGQLYFRPASRDNLIVGLNAQGKTSLLESICVLLRLHSPRTSMLAEAIQHNQQEFSLDGICLGSHLQLRRNITHRSLYLNSEKQNSTRQYLSVARIAWFANSDGELISGKAECRRRYLDFIGAQIDWQYLFHLRIYDRAWRYRNFLLKENRSRKEIRAFDKSLVVAGEAIASSRRYIVNKLAPLFLQAVGNIAGKEEAVNIHYKPGFQSNFHEELLASEEEEQRFGYTVVGIHRDELYVSLAEGAAAIFASEGQKRTLALALKLAQARLLASCTGYMPILLIDDVFGELDRERCERLLSQLPVEAQKLITTTSLGRIIGDREDISIFRLVERQLIKGHSCT